METFSKIIIKQVIRVHLIVFFFKLFKTKTFFLKVFLEKSLPKHFYKKQQIR